MESTSALPDFEPANKSRPVSFDPGIRRGFFSSTQQLRAFFFSQTQDNHQLAVFVHGFAGNYLSTWGLIPHLLWTGADTDAILRNWDFLFIGYETRKIHTYLDIAERIGTEWGYCFSGSPPYPRKYAKVSLFGHSLGTLGIRQFLCATAKHHESLAQCLHSVTLFGSPLAGSKLAYLANVTHPIAKALTPLNPQLRMLRVWSEGSFKYSPWPPVRVVVGQGDWIAGTEMHELVTWPGDLTPEITTLGHSDLVRPDAWQDSVVLNSVRMVLR